MKIRPMVKEDVRLLCGMAEDFAEHGGFESAGLGCVRQDFAEFLKKFHFSDQCRVFVALVDGNVAGTICGVVAPWMLQVDQKLLIEQFLWIDPWYRGRGVGSALIDALSTWGRDVGCSHLIMVSLDLAGASVDKFYTGQGFSRLETHYIRGL